MSLIGKLDHYHLCALRSHLSQHKIVNEATRGDIYMYIFLNTDVSVKEKISSAMSQPQSYGEQ